MATSPKSHPDAIGRENQPRAPSPAPAYPGPLQSRRLIEVVRQGVSYGLLISLSVMMATPFLWMVSTALKPSTQVFSLPPEWFPRPYVWRNFIESLTLLGHPVHLYAWNTTVITVLGVVGVLISSSLVAFGFARLEFPGRDALFLLLLSTMMLPPAVVMVPKFILFRDLGWLDSFKPLVVPYWFGAPFHIFLLRQFFLTLPKDLDDAARVDGASNWQIYWHVILPLSRPALATVAIFAFVYHWNDLLEPLIYLSSQSNWTLALYLSSFQGYIDQVPLWNLMMAASTVLVLPVLILFFFTQHLFIGGITVTGIKG